MELLRLNTRGIAMSGSGFAERHAGESPLQACEVAILRRAVRGEVVARGDVTYDQARRVWNGMIDRAQAQSSTAPAPTMLLQPSSLHARGPC